MTANREAMLKAIEEAYIVNRSSLIDPPGRLSAELALTAIEPLIAAREEAARTRPLTAHELRTALDMMIREADDRDLHALVSRVIRDAVPDDWEHDLSVGEAMEGIEWLEEEDIQLLCDAAADAAMSVMSKRYAEVARSQEFYPGTLTGRRQAWLREAIACRIEGGEPPEAPSLDDRPLVEAARREEREACIETIWNLSTLWTAQRNVIKRCVDAIRARSGNAP